MRLIKNKTLLTVTSFLLAFYFFLLKDLWVFGFGGNASVVFLTFEIPTLQIVGAWRVFLIILGIMFLIQPIYLLVNTLLPQNKFFTEFNTSQFSILEKICVIMRDHYNAIDTIYKNDLTSIDIMMPRSKNTFNDDKFVRYGPDVKSNNYLVKIAKSEAKVDGFAYLSASVNGKGWIGAGESYTLQSAVYIDDFHKRLSANLRDNIYELKKDKIDELNKSYERVKHRFKSLYSFPIVQNAKVKAIINFNYRTINPLGTKESWESDPLNNSLPPSIDNFASVIEAIIDQLE
jgi:hypothetical protein